MKLVTDYAIALLGAGCALLATPGSSALAQRLPGDREISETFIFRTDRHNIIDHTDIQPGAGGRTWTGQLDSVLGDMKRSQHQDFEFAEAEPSIVKPPSPMIIDLQHPEAW